MLVDPLYFVNDPTPNMIADVMGGGDGSGTPTQTRLGPGMYQIAHFSFNYSLGPQVSSKYDLDLGDWDDPTAPFSYGVCDTPAQLIEKFPMLETDPRRFVVSFTHVAKDPTNRGQGGGWRWHKWGPYIGDHEHEYEYLDDEVGFEDGIYVYGIYELVG